MGRTLVTFHAHPDDESMLTAGVMAKAAAQGHRVVLVVATQGEVGRVGDDFLAAGEELGQRRRAELERSAEILGVARIEWLGYRDSGSDAEHGAAPTTGSFAAADVDEAARRLADLLSEEQADVLTVYDGNGGYGHPDHVQVNRVGYRAAEVAGTPVVLEATVDRDLLSMGLDMAGSLGYELPADLVVGDLSRLFTATDEITHNVDVSEFLDAKRASMAAHASQTTGADSQLDSNSARSLAVFLSLPDPLFALAFGTEWFVERGRDPGMTATDVFASLRSPAEPSEQNEP